MCFFRAIIVITLHYTTLKMIYICNMFNRKKDCYSIIVFMTIPWWVSLHEKQSLIVLGTRSDPIITSVSMSWGEDEEVVLSSIELVFLDQGVCFKCDVDWWWIFSSVCWSIHSLDPSFRVLLPSEWWEIVLLTSDSWKKGCERVEREWMIHSFIRWRYDSFIRWDDTSQKGESRERTTRELCSSISHL